MRGGGAEGFGGACSDGGITEGAAGGGRAETGRVGGLEVGNGGGLDGNGGGGFEVTTGGALGGGVEALYDGMAGAMGVDTAGGVGLLGTGPAGAGRGGAVFVSTAGRALGGGKGRPPPA